MTSLTIADLDRMIEINKTHDGDPEFRKTAQEETGNSVTWVLLINPPSLMTQRFLNEENCQAAAAWIRIQASPLRIDTICLEDVKK